MEEDMNIIKSLIAISKGGLALDNIPSEFREMNGSCLNFRKYGFNSLEQMLQSSKEIELYRTSSGIICRVNDSKMMHVTSLVDRAKKSKPRKKASRSKSAYFHTSKGGYSSPQRYGARRGSPNEPYRKPFHQANKMQYDDYRTRPQSVGRLPSATSAKHHSQSTFRTSRYQSNFSSSTSHAHNSRYDKSQRLEQKPVQSSCIGSSVSKPKPKVNSSPGWSSDSSEHIQPPSTVLSCVGWTSRSAQGKTLSEDKFSSSNQNILKAPDVRVNCLKTDSLPASMQDQPCSDRSSDWSSDSRSDSSPTGVPKRTVIPPPVERSLNPLQNGGVSSTIKFIQNSSNGSRELGTGRIQAKYDSSDWSTDSSDHEFDKTLPSSVHYANPSSNGIGGSVVPLHINPPLMVGGIGRGRSRPTVDFVKPGKNEFKAVHSSSTDVIVTGSPSKRETSTTFKNGLANIRIKIRNDPVVQVQRPKKMRTSQTLLNSRLQTITSYEFIGDFLLQRVAEVSMGLYFPENGGLCHSSATIVDCLERIQSSPRSRGLRPVVLMIGMTDILEGATLEEMQHCMTQLLKKLSTRNIVLLTLPVLPIFMEKSFERELAVLENYNSWLLSLQLPNTIETEQHLYCDGKFYEQSFGTSGLETFSEEGCWVVYDEIMGATV